MKRKNGYYWVKREDNWIIAYYDGTGWMRIGTDGEYTDFDWQEINNIEITR